MVPASCPDDPLVTTTLFPLLRAASISSSDRFAPLCVGENVVVPLAVVVVMAEVAAGVMNMSNANSSRLSRPSTRGRKKRRLGLLLRVGLREKMNIGGLQSAFKVRG